MHVNTNLVLVHGIGVLIINLSLQNLLVGAHTIGYWCLLAIYVTKDSIYILFKYSVHNTLYVDNLFGVGV